MRHKSAAEDADQPTQKTVFQGRDGLAAYTIDPESFPPSRVVYYNEKFVVINDLYPKASVHLLILPRDPIKNVQRPQTAFDDPQFLAECREEEKKVRDIVAVRRISHGYRRSKLMIRLKRFRPGEIGLRASCLASMRTRL
jgi:aprataxin